MKPEEARRFIAGKLFAFNCFEGTRGAGRIYADGSVSGSIQFGGSGPVRNVRLPASFRGSISGLGFAYCEFNRKSGRVDLATMTRSRAANVRPVSATAESNDND